MKPVHILWYGLAVLFATLAQSCKPSRGSSAGAEGEELPLRHASLLSMAEADSFTLVTVRDAWHEGRVLARYVLVPSSQPLPSRRPEGQVVRTPLRRVVSTTSVHAALLYELGADSSLCGLTDVRYAISPSLRRGLRTGRIADMGTAAVPDVERLRAARTDAVLVSPFENAGHGSLDNLDVPLIECADYMETSPLGRAEWMRFYGRLVGRGAEADALFAEVERRYLACKRKAAEARGPKPTVFFDLKTGDTWFQPGGGSTMGQLMADAGGSYLWADRAESGSLSLNMELVYSRAAQADCWMVKYGAEVPLTYVRMAADCPQYAQFRAWRERHVYACNTQQVPFYEEVPFHPDRLLAEWAAILRGDRTVKLRYYTPLSR